MTQGKLKLQFKNSVEKFKDFKQQFSKHKPDSKQARNEAAKQIQENYGKKQLSLESPIQQEKEDKFDTEESSTSLTSDLDAVDNFVPKFSIQYENSPDDQKEKQVHSQKLLKSASLNLKNLDSQHSKEFFKTARHPEAQMQGPNQYNRISEDGQELESPRMSFRHRKQSISKPRQSLERTASDLKRTASGLKRTASQNMDSNTITADQHLAMSQLEHKIFKTFSLPMKKLKDLQPTAADYQTYQSELLDGIDAQPWNHAEKQKAKSKVLATVKESSSNDKELPHPQPSRKVSESQKHLMLDRTATGDELLLSKLQQTKPINFKDIPEQNEIGKRMSQELRNSLKSLDRKLSRGQSQKGNRLDDLSDGSVLKAWNSINKEVQDKQQGNSQRQLNDVNNSSLYKSQGPKQKSNQKALGKTQSDVPQQSARSFADSSSKSFDKQQWIKFKADNTQEADLQEPKQGTNPFTQQNLETQESKPQQDPTKVSSPSKQVQNQQSKDIGFENDAIESKGQQEQAESVKMQNQQDIENIKSEKSPKHGTNPFTQLDEETQKAKNYQDSSIDLPPTQRLQKVQMEDIGFEDDAFASKGQQEQTESQAEQVQQDKKEPSIGFEDDAFASKGQHEQTESQAAQVQQDKKEPSIGFEDDAFASKGQQEQIEPQPQQVQEDKKYLNKNSSPQQQSKDIGFEDNAFISESQQGGTESATQMQSDQLDSKNLQSQNSDNRMESFGTCTSNPFNSLEPETLSNEQDGDNLQKADQKEIDNNQNIQNISEDKQMQNKDQTQQNEQMQPQDLQQSQEQKQNNDLAQNREGLQEVQNGAQTDEQPRPLEQSVVSKQDQEQQPMPQEQDSVKETNQIQEHEPSNSVSELTADQNQTQYSLQNDFNIKDKQIEQSKEQGIGQVLEENGDQKNQDEGKEDVGIKEPEAQKEMQREISLEGFNQDQNKQIDQAVEDTEKQSQPQASSQQDQQNETPTDTNHYKDVNQQQTQQQENKSSEQSHTQSKDLQNEPQQAKQINQSEVKRADSFGDLSCREFDGCTLQNPVNTLSKEQSPLQIRFTIGDKDEVKLNMDFGCQKQEDRSFNPFVPFMPEGGSGQVKNAFSFQKYPSNYAESFAFDGSGQSSLEASNDAIHNSQHYQNVKDEQLTSHSDSDFEFSHADEDPVTHTIRQQESLGKEKLFQMKQDNIKNKGTDKSIRQQQHSGYNPFYDQRYMQQKAQEVPLLNESSDAVQNPFYQMQGQQNQQFPQAFSQGYNQSPQQYQQNPNYQYMQQQGLPQQQYQQQPQFSNQQQVRPQQQLQSQYYPNQNNQYQPTVPLQQGIQTIAQVLTQPAYSQQQQQQQQNAQSQQTLQPQQSFQSQQSYQSQPQYASQGIQNQPYNNNSLSSQNSFQQQAFYNQQQPQHYQAQKFQPQFSQNQPHFSQSPTYQQYSPQQYQQLHSQQSGIQQQSPNQQSKSANLVNQNNQGLQAQASTNNPFYSLQNNNTTQWQNQQNGSTTPQFQQTQAGQTQSQPQLQSQNTVPKNQQNQVPQTEIKEIEPLSLDQFIEKDMDLGTASKSSLQLRDQAMQVQTMQGVVKLLSDNSLYKINQQILAGNLSHIEILVAYQIIEKTVDAAIYALKELLQLTSKEVLALFDLNQPRQSIAQQVVKRMREIQKERKLSMLTEMRRAGFEWFNILAPSDVEDLFQQLIVQHSRYYNIVQLSAKISSTMWKLFYMLKIQEQIAEASLQLIEGFYKSFNYIQQTTFLNLSIEKCQQGVEYLSYICQIQNNDMDQVFFGGKRSVDTVYHINSHVEKVAKEIVEMNAIVVLLESLKLHPSQDEVITNSSLALLTLGTITEWSMESILKNNGCTVLLQVLFPKRARPFSDYLSLLITEVDVIQSYNKQNKDPQIKNHLDNFMQVQTKLNQGSKQEEENLEEAENEDNGYDEENEPYISITDLLTPPSVREDEFINHWKDDPAYSVQLKSRSFSDESQSSQLQWGTQKTDDALNSTKPQPSQTQNEKFNAPKSMSYQTNKENKKFKLSNFKKMGNSATRQFSKFMREGNQN